MARRRATPKKSSRISDVNFRHGGMKGRSFNRQLQRSIVVAYSFCRSEYVKHSKSGKFVVPLHKIKDRVARILGIHPKTVQRYMSKFKGKRQLRTPGKDRKVPRPVRNIDSFTAGAIRRLIYEYHRKRLPFTVKDLLEKCRERDIDFHGGTETLRKVMHDLGFRFKGRNARRHLMELPRITALRTKFLIKFMEKKKAGRVMVYTDETWYFEKGSNKTKEWQSDNVQTCSTRYVSSGRRHILVHAGTADGFLEGAGLTYSSASKGSDDDYHGDVNTTVMKKYWREKILPNLPPEPCTIVLDNASYHKSKVGDVPISKMVKHQLLQFLTDQGAQIKDARTPVSKLRKMAQMFKAKSFIEQMLEDTIHDSLYLPPYHCHYNPIELVWGIVKRYYDKHVGRNNDYSIKMCQKIIDEAIATVTPEVWSKVVAKVEAHIFQDYFSQVPADCHVIKPIVIRVGEESSDEEEEGTDPDDPQPVHSFSHRSPYCDSNAPGERAVSTNKWKVTPSSCPVPSTSTSGVGAKKRLSFTADSPVTNEVNDPTSQELEFRSPPAEISLQWSYIPGRIVPETELHCAVAAISNDDVTPSVRNSVHTDLLKRLLHGRHAHVPVFEPFERKSAVENGHLENEIKGNIDSSISDILSELNIDIIDNVACRDLDKLEEVPAAVDHTIPLHGDKQDQVVVRKCTSLPEKQVNDTCALDCNEKSQELGCSTQLSVKEIMKQSDDFKILQRRRYVLTVKDLKTLLPSKWLNDEVIMVYLHLVADSVNSLEDSSVFVMNTFFYQKVLSGYEGVRRWTRNVDIFSFQLILIPIHLGNHWVLCTINMKAKTITYFDSLGHENRESQEVVLEFLKVEYRERKGRELPFYEWDLVHCTNAPQQKNSDDCGVFVLAFARLVAEGRSILFDCSNMSDVRLSIMAEIVSGKLLPETLKNIIGHNDLLPSRSKDQWPRKWKKDPKCDKLKENGLRNASTDKVLSSQTKKVKPDFKVEHYIPIGGSAVKAGKTVPAVPPTRTVGCPPQKSKSPGTVAHPKPSRTCKPWPNELRTATDGVFLVQSARMSQKSACFAASKNAQCTAISVQAIAAFNVKKPPFSRDLLDSIVIEGDEYYRKLRGKSTSDFLSPEDLAGPIKFDNKLFSFELDICGGGTFDETVLVSLQLVIENALNSYKMLRDKYGFLFVGHTKTVSFTKFSESVFLYFNSHSVDRNNRVEMKTIKGAARLFRCLSVTALANCILTDHPRDGAHWMLYCISLG